MAHQRRVVSAIVASTLVLIAGCFTATPAHACSCVSRDTAEALARADAVFAGTVTEAGAERYGWALRFAVSGVYKGAVHADQVVHTPAGSSASCGLDAAVGSTWIIFARAETEAVRNQIVTRLHTNLCSGTMPAGRPPPLLGDAQAPLDGASNQVEQSLQADVTARRTVMALGVGMLALAVVLAWIGLAPRRQRIA